MTDFKELDISDWGSWELGEASELLDFITSGKMSSRASRHLDSDTAKIGFNMNTPSVFLFDENGGVAVSDGKKLVLFLSCPECGHEGNEGEFDNGIDDYGCPHCTEYSRALE